jgi:tetracycline 7-halogenase / FADH2 O2-dependent halogenase
MRREEAEIAIVGAGFAGSLTALILHRLGRRVVLIERGRHPRYVIGESSTPLANLVLADLARKYGLPRLAPLSKYGSWKRAYPEMTSGLKRGFTFFQHHAGQPFRPTPNHAEELLVAASPADDVADTHWFRPEFDHFLVKEVEAAGVPYLDQTRLHVADRRPQWLLRGEREGEDVEITCRFVVDASGPGGFLSNALGIDTRPTAMRTNSWSVYSWFENVGRFEGIVHELGGMTSDYPYRCDDAAVHHILDDGWMWVLPFDNGVTSAGFLFDGTRRQSDSSLTAEAEWQATMARYPSIAAHFARARPVQPWFRTGRLQRCATTMAGDDWVLLPHAAYALDALFSVGNAHTLLGIERLADVFDQHWNRPTLAPQLRHYESILRNEMRFLDELVRACYRCFGRFRLFAATCMCYFAGVHSLENKRRTGRCGPGDRFVSAHHEPFAAAVRAIAERVAGVCGESDIAQFESWIREQIRPLNDGGFCDPAKANMYPCA